MYTTGVFYNFRILLSSKHQPTTTTLFPYTTLFRSVDYRAVGATSTVIHLWPTSPVNTQGIRGVFRIHPQKRLTGDDSNFGRDRKSTRLNSSHVKNSYAVFCLKKKNKKEKRTN